MRPRVTGSQDSHPVSGALLSATYFGGSGYDEAHAVTVRDSGDFVLVGETDSPNLTMIGALQPTLRRRA